MTREDLAKFHDVWIRPKRFDAGLVGDTTLAEADAETGEIFLPGWKAGKRRRKTWHGAAQAPKSVVYLVDKPGALQSVIIAGMWRRQRIIRRKLRLRR